MQPVETQLRILLADARILIASASDLAGTPDNDATADTWNMHLAWKTRARNWYKEVAEVLRDGK